MKTPHMLRSLRAAFHGASFAGQRRPWGRPRLTRSMLVRMAADAIMVNAALLAALLLRMLLPESSAWRPVGTPLQDYLHTYLIFALPLTLTCLCVFSASGFYTRGRRYRRRYKTLVISQGVCLSYLVFAFEVLLLRDVVSFPRAGLLLAWLLTWLFVGGTRLWAWLWAALAEADRRAQAAAAEPEAIKSVLVVGGAGYVGSALTERLLELGYRVRVLDRLIYGDESIAAFRHHPRFELMRGDFRHIDAVVKASQGMDAIVHLGAIVGDAACQICENLTTQINLWATSTIAEVGKGFGVKRFVFASTCSVYGASEEIVDERSDLSPLSLYARTKYESEKILLGLADASFAPTILRFGTIYGLSGRTRFDLVVNLLAAKAVQDGEISIAGGSQWRPLVHVKDVAKAIVGTLQAPRDSVCGQTFNVGCNKQNYQIAEIGRMVGKMVPGARVVFQPDGDNRNYRVSFDKIQKAIDFEPEYTVRDGIEEIVQAFRDGKIVDYRDPRYNNSVYLRQHAELLEDTGEAWPLNGHGGSPAHLPVPEAAKAGALPQPVASSPAA